jgi:Zn-dependent M28 family amino/carboxypeptidase
MLRKPPSAFLFIGFIIPFIIACTDSNLSSQPVLESVNTQQLLSDIKYLSSDELEGRKTGTQGNLLAQDFIKDRFSSIGIQPVDGTYEQVFEHQNNRSGEVFENAVNLIGLIEGTSESEEYIVITAHYDHLGVRGDDIYNGADDNASGTAGILAIAEYFSNQKPQNNLLFIAFDAEEQGLAGAYHFVETPTISLNQIALNVNLDMISTNFQNELYAVGTYHYPYLKPLIEEATAEAAIDVLFGYDSDEWSQNWTLASDHGPFHLKGVPFIYFGVEDHEHYHQPTDVYESINEEFFIHSVETIIDVIQNFDRNLETILTQK